MTFAFIIDLRSELELDYEEIPYLAGLAEIFTRSTWYLWEVNCSVLSIVIGFTAFWFFIYLHTGSSKPVIFTEPTHSTSEGRMVFGTGG